jgi:hypothetical protein
MTRHNVRCKQCDRLESNFKIVRYLRSLNLDSLISFIIIIHVVIELETFVYKCSLNNPLEGENTV